MTEAQASATRICARIVGPLMFIIGVVVVARSGELATLIPAITGDAPLAFITGIFTLICGVVLFAAHHHVGSWTAAVITALGALTIVRGVSLLFAPDIVASFANTMLAKGPAVTAAGAVAALLGLWLSYAGWFAKDRA